MNLDMIGHITGWVLMSLSIPLFIVMVWVVRETLMHPVDLSEGDQLDEQ